MTKSTTKAIVFAQKLLQSVRTMSSSSSNFKDSSFNTLTKYIAPRWTQTLANVPEEKIQLGHLCTPIHKWNLPGLPPDVELFIKRDDMTGSTLGGNKIRKLEFILADAVRKGCKHVITCGGIQSNHCRAVAVATAQLSLQCHLILRAGYESTEEAGCKGNVFLDKMCGAKLYLTPKPAPYATELLPRMERLAAKIKSETGEESYVMEVGGSNEVGVYGYVECFHEMINQGVLEEIDDVAFATGSGGTAEGLALANYLTGSKLRVHGIAVSDDAKYFYNHGNKVLSKISSEDIELEDILKVIEGAKGLGYGLSTQDELDFITEVSRSTGIILDPVYTGKAVRSLVRELNENPQQFKGKRILYVHTGGIFGTYDGRLDSTLEKVVKNTNSCKLWTNKEDTPSL